MEKEISIYSHVDLIGYVWELNKRDNINKKLAKKFWNVFFETRKQLFIIQDWFLVVWNQAFEDAYKKKLNSITTWEKITCSEVTHSDGECWSKLCPCPIDLSKSCNWNYAIDDHIHTNKDWIAFISEVWVIQLKNIFSQKMRKKHKDKIRFSVHTSNSSIFLHTSKDVTDQRLLEKKASNEHDANIRANQANESSKLLQQALHAAETANKKAQIANAAKSSFLANMSHELRTPLHAIMWVTERLLLSDNTDSTLSDSETIRLHTMIQRSANILTSLIGDILDLTKIENWDFELDRKSFNLKQFIDNIFEIFIVSANNKNINLELEYDESLTKYIVTDSDRLSQILINIIWNAIKFTSEWWVMLICKNTDSWIYFEIQDSWIWIAASNLKKVFYDYQQANLSIRKKFWWTWLWLAISKKLVSQMWWTLKVNSIINVWSTFYFTLPLTIGDEPLAELKDSSEMKNCFKWKNVLLVEDNIVNQEVTSLPLSYFWCEITIANNWQEAVDLYKKRDIEFDIILMDLQMPEMDGVKATEIIRTFEKRNKISKIPIIAQTWNVLSEQKRACLEVWMNDFITKPIKKETLAIAMREHLLSQNSTTSFTTPNLYGSYANIEMLHRLKTNIWELKNNDIIQQTINNLLEVKDKLFLINNDINTKSLLIILGEIEDICTAYWIRISILITKLKKSKTDLHIPIIEIRKIENELTNTIEFFLNIYKNWINIAAPKWNSLILDVEEFNMSELLENQFSKKIRELQKEDMAEIIITTYLEDFDKATERIKNSVNNIDPSELRESAHYLKSSGDSLGTVRMRKICHWLERLWMSWDKLRIDSDEARDVLKIFDNEIIIIKRYLEPHLNWSKK